MQNSARPAPPKLIGSYSSGGTGAWYAGGQPAGGKNAPVLVFVPGFQQTASSFWKGDFYCGDNDMYRMAYHAGYRTAFVTFNPQGESASDMWRNGKMLAWQLGRIRRYFHTPSVTVIAHSKGGVDAQTAAVFNGADSSIERLVTLSTPHWGSFLADIAYSSAGWHLAELLGLHCGGCYCMQTDYMAEYRKLTDAKMSAKTELVTLAGRGAGPLLTPLWMGGVALGRYGENDGVVTVSSARNPHGKHAATLNLNHSQMRSGKFVWPALSGVLHSSTAAPETRFSQQEVSGAAVPCCGSIVRGGKTDEGVGELFDIDSTAEGAELIVHAAGKAVFSLLEPDGKTAHAFESRPEPAGGLIFRQELRHPSPGRWKLVCVPAEGAYLAVLSLYGGKENPQELRVGNLRADMRILRTFPDHAEPVGEYESGQDAPALKSGFYSMETTLRGELNDGSPYHRTLTNSLLVRPDGSEPAEFLTTLLQKARVKKV